MGLGNLEVGFPPSADVLGIMPTELHASARGKDDGVEGVKREREVKAAGLDESRTGTSEGKKIEEN